MRSRLGASISRSPWRTSCPARSPGAAWRRATSCACSIRRFVKLGARPSERAYLEQEHVIVSYNNDLRGMIEDQFGRERRIKCSVASFAGVGAIVDGGRLVATLPILIATQIL